MVSASTASTAPVQAPRARAPAWLAVASLALSTFSSVTTEFLPVGLLGDIARGLRVTAGAAGLMVTMPALTAAVAGPLLIVLARRLDRRLLLLALSALLIVSNLAAALAPNLPVMLAARVLLGVCVGGFWTIAPSVTAQLVPAPSQGRAMSTVMAGISVATIGGVPAGALLGSLAGWRVAFAASAVVAAGVLALQWRVLPKVPAERAIPPRELLEPLKAPPARLVLATALLLVCGHFVGYTYLQPTLERVFALSAGGVTAALLAFGVAGFLGTFAAGRTVTGHLRSTVFAAAATIALVLLLSALWGAGAPGAMAAALAWGGAFGLVPVAMTTWMLRALPAAPEAGQAMLVSFFQVAISSGAFLGGWLVDAHGIAGVLLAGAALAASAAVVVGAARSLR